ncbi:hypothetical protein COV53_06195 [Candidatus Gottesmanbacteria bacterium CG11_big_fil_rev_8_21_14_0_20_37_11]|uniref:ChsH2 C-terminal OB-fold domain-containing protein n=3 Tax=Candidatus Gottesmaniibacteriota TaxID=1752720 RepID=A0A2M7RR99_9BACT|nr:MAG: hypothetical protein AUJ73_04770 [Candidatus Gottesmanbacteria bacterium CG1_02_37_22]PIP32371.1 MAG: hypothetical protein COX23_05110 [Candidatus Gottesmanbacteria bacterium CG23_combo_of_CG06-09_8_20_14_all_37_19]PIR07808.1 MAG: hypothetical protein COV53_06195 [Candidatus Gottesmanbacteria bacterium CG11_big_fil_rev_8_21_14_0_20_37_11]PIZ02826.1 MAG: hypothetical protein COY59_02585 [Candidatus Gottesmanbacteria bacterium CG_4_10_14_0_8_um_filter_37_24]
MTISPVKIWRNQKKVRAFLGKTGRIITWTKVHVPPCSFTSQAPYVIIVVEIDKNLRFTAQLVDWEETNLKTGQTVKAILRKTRDPGLEGVIPYGIKFKPI